MNTCYLDCFSGVSGNMLLGALLDGGLKEKTLRAILDTLPISGYQLHIQQIKKQGLAACFVQVKITEEQPHRHPLEIADIINSSALADTVKEKSLRVFARLAKAEAKVHGTTVEQVHFHEVGAVDALIDIVGTVAGFEHLGIDCIYCSSLPMPNGLTICKHGTIPLPAPAVCALLQDVPMYGVELNMELVTPTGAALVSELTHDFGPMPAMTLLATGYGAGSHDREDGCPNLLRLCFGHSHRVTEAGEVEIIQTHLDDWNMETWPHLSDRLMSAGALDVSLTPIQMKKGRPGFELKIISAPTDTLQLKQIILTETSAIGLRFHRQQRMTLPRTSVTVTTPLGVIQGKKILSPDGPTITPEYESCRKLALEKGVSIQRIYDEFYRYGTKTDSNNV